MRTKIERRCGVIGPVLPGVASECRRVTVTLL